MIRATVLLVVLSLSGAPVVNGACAGWCASASTPCCDMAAMPPVSIVADGSCTCAAARADVPMLREDTARYTPVLLAVLPAPTHSRVEPMSRVRTFVAIPARDRGPAPPLVLRL